LAAPSTPLSTAASADADVGDGAVVMSKAVLADCVKEMDRLKKLPAYLWFQDPVDPVKLQIPTYFDVIKKPMDFGTVGRKLAAGTYPSAQAFRDDLLLVVNNAIGFNPADHQCHIDALRLRNIISTNLSKLISNHSSRSKAPVPSASSPTVVSLFDLPITNAGPTSSLFASCETIVQACMDKDVQKWFCQPIHPENDGIPHYRTIIKEPMDLSTVRSNLRAHKYAHFMQPSSHARAAFPR
jgi:bromodomain-containing factor 1